jgi:hypothetical protein
MFTTWLDTLEAHSDEAIIPGYNPVSEYRVRLTNIFTYIFQALTRHDVKQMTHNRIKVETFTSPMKGMLEDFVRDENAPKSSICPSQLRVIPNGTISKNSRYFQNQKIFGTHVASTTDAGLEGAMTKTSFNFLNHVSDFNDALLSFILTGYSGLMSAAGHVGSCPKVDHDTTYLLEEI